MTNQEFGNRLLELLRNNLGWGSRVTAGHLSLQVAIDADVFEIYYHRMLSAAQRDAAARARGWVVLADVPRAEGETDTSYWKRIWALMPESQRRSPAGAIAQFGTYEIRPGNVLMTAGQYNSLLGCLETCPQKEQCPQMETCPLVAVEPPEDKEKDRG